MADGINFSGASAYRDFVQQYADKFINKLFYGFPSAGLVTPHEGVKGRKTLTELVLGRLVRRYGKTFTPQEAITFVPRHLDVVDAKVDFEFVPKDFEGNYLGALRRKGQDSMDWPFQQYMLEYMLEGVLQEMEDAIWNGEAAAAPASTDYLDMLFDGIVRIVSEEAAASNITPYVSGALSNTNTVGHVEAMYKLLGKAYKFKEMDCFAALNVREKYIADYRERYSKNWGDTDQVRFDMGVMKFHFLPGIPDDFIMVTPKENLHYGYDGPMDHTLFNFEQEDRKMKIWMDFKMGVNLGIVHDDLLVVNDAALIVIV